MLKSYGVGGPCDFSVSPSPFGLDFGTLDFGLGLDNFFKRPQDPDKDARWISLCGCFLWYRDDWSVAEIFGSYDNKSKLS